MTNINLSRTDSNPLAAAATISSTSHPTASKATTPTLESQTDQYSFSAATTIERRKEVIQNSKDKNHEKNDSTERHGRKKVAKCTGHNTEDNTEHITGIRSKDENNEKRNMNLTEAEAKKVSIKCAEHKTENENRSNTIITEVEASNETLSKSNIVKYDSDSMLLENEVTNHSDNNYWYGKRRFARTSQLQMSHEFRRRVRNESFCDPTNSVCPGLLQCNLVILHKEDAYDFLLFCQRNSKACPLIEVCDTGSPYPVGVAHNADLRTDVPQYTIWKHGKAVKTVKNIIEFWPNDKEQPYVSFLLGCSFTFDDALMKEGIYLRSVAEKKNVPMFKTSIPCRSAGRFKGNMVVSMKPIKCTDIAKYVQITSQFPHAHGAPICIGCSESIGIADVSKPEYGTPVDILDDEVPVFHACGVTPQNVIVESQIPFCITHSPGYMFVTDILANPE